MTFFQNMLLIFLLACAITVSFIKRILSAVIIFMSYSVVISIVWLLLASPDLALTEAAVGAGITSILFFLTIKRIDKMEKDRQAPTPAHSQASDDHAPHPTKKKEGTLLAGSFYRICAVLLVLSVIGVLLLTMSYMPPFGGADNPTNNEVYSRYIEKGVEDTGAINIVAAMILDYRAFDTLGESFVLFTAVMAVIMLIRASPGSSGAQMIKSTIDSMQQPLILRIGTMMMVPFILVYGAYIIFNGHLSPGGGFSGGTILGAGISLWAIAFGAEKVRRVFNFKTYTLSCSCALLFYALVKGYSFFMGASGHSTGIPLGRPGAILSAGLILPLNICVGIVVACTVYSLYALFSEGEV